MALLELCILFDCRKWTVFEIRMNHLACENIRFSSLFVAEDVSRFVPPRETSTVTKSEEKRMFSQAINH